MTQLERDIFKELFPRLPHRQFMEKTRCKDMDGIYRSLNNGHIHVVKNVWLRGFISEDGEAYDGYTASIRSTNPDIGEHGRIVLENVPWEFLLKL